MADEPISSLTAYSTQHGDDLYVVVDVHDTTMASTGTDKKATTYQVFGSPSSGQLIYWSGSLTGVPAGAADLTVGSSGQLNFAAISAPGSPVAGDTWFDLTQLCHVHYGGSGTSADCLAAYRVGLIYSQTAKVTVTTTGAVSLVSTSGATGSVLLPAGYLNVTGRSIRITAGGFYSSGSTQGTVYWFAKLGSNVFATTTSALTMFGASQTTRFWTLSAVVTTKGTGASGLLDTAGGADGVSIKYRRSVRGPAKREQCRHSARGTQFSLDLTQSYTFDFQINMTGTSNTFVLTNLTLEVLG